MNQNREENLTITSPLQIAYNERDNGSPSIRPSRDERAWQRHLAAEKADMDRRIAGGLIIEW